MVSNMKRHSESLRSSTQRRPILHVVQVLIWILMMDCVPASAAAVFSAEPNTDPEGRQWIVTVRGEIEPEDTKRLQAFLRQRVPPEGGTTDYWGNVIISLDSPGGDFAEGLKLANSIYDGGMATLVRNGNTCASACALAFLGGSSMDEDMTRTDRSLQVGGKLQFHAPYVRAGTVTTDRADLVRQLTDVNIELLQSITTRFKVPPSMVQTLLRNDQKHSLYTVDTVRMLVGLGVTVEGLYRPKALTLEMATNLCVNANAGDDGVPNPGGEVLFDASRDVQATEKMLRMRGGEFGDGIAVPVALYGDEGVVTNYCNIQRAEDGSFSCFSTTVTIDPESVRSAGNLNYGGEGCKFGTSPSDILVVPVETKLQDYKSVAQRMEARGKSLFDVAVSQGKPSSKSNDQGFICNDQAGFANMREGPHGKSFAVVVRLTNNTSVKVLEETSNSETGHPWLKISAKGKEGFVDKDLVSLEKCAHSTTTTIQPAADFKPGKAVICNSEASFANMRSGPGPQNDLVMALDNKTTVKKLAAAVNEETQHPWLKIQAKGRTGYVDAEKVEASCDMAP